MSLSLLKRFKSSLAPRLRRSQALRIGLCAERVFLSTGEELAVPASEEGVPAWWPAVDVLGSKFSTFKNQEVSVILADRFVRYALLPWSETLKTHDQWLGLARHRFCAIHGPLAADWEIKFAETAPAGPRLACAVDGALVEELGTRALAQGVQLVSVQPYLIAAFNRLRGRVISPGGSCWMVVEEPGRLTLALFLKGVWVAIRTRRADERWRRVLPEIIARESGFLGLEEPCTRVVVCAQGPFDAEEHESFRLDAVSYRELALAGN